MKTFDKRDRAIKDAIKAIAPEAREGVHYKLVKEGKRWGWEALGSPAETVPTTPPTTSDAPATTSPGMARLAASGKAEKIQQEVLADQKKAAKEAAAIVREYVAKDRVYDVGAASVHGTVHKAGKEVCEIKWDQAEPWGKTSNTLTKNLRIVEDGIPEFLKAKGRKTLTPEEEAKLVPLKKGSVVAEGKKHDPKLPRNIEPAGQAILEGREKPATSKVSATIKKEAKGKRQKASWPPSAKITILKKDNPKRPGSGAEKFYNMYKPGMLVSKYIDLVGPRGPFLIKYDTAHGFIKVVD